MKDMKKNCRDSMALPYEIHDSFGANITFKDDEGIEYTSVSELPRQVSLDVRSFIGMCWNAIHYYAHLRVSDLGLKFIRDGKEQTSWMGGAFDRHKPEACKAFDIEIVRPVTKEEIESEPDRWYCYKEGDNTNGFEDEEELIELGIKIFKERFKGKWILKIYGIDHDYEPITSNS